MYLSTTPRSYSSEENSIDVDALVRRLQGEAFSDWPETVEPVQDDTVVPFPSLHDLVEAARGKPAQAPRRLWTGDPFGGDAA
ncbi:MAG: hypothetical protein U1F61_20885 [Opitutaceae bacterium]